MFTAPLQHVRFARWYLNKYSFGISQLFVLLIFLNFHREYLVFRSCMWLSTSPFHA